MLLEGRVYRDDKRKKSDLRARGIRKFPSFFEHATRSAVSRRVTGRPGFRCIIVVFSHEHGATRRTRICWNDINNNRYNRNNIVAYDDRATDRRTPPVYPGPLNPGVSDEINLRIPSYVQRAYSAEGRARGAGGELRGGQGVEGRAES